MPGFLFFLTTALLPAGRLAYVFRRTVSGVFDGATADGVNSIFSDLVSDPERLLAWHTIFMVMTMMVVARGVKEGLEQAVRYLMPALLVLLFLVVGYSMSTGYFMQGVEFLFTPGPISGEGVLIAMGHAFFTLSLGMGAIMVYGSYLPEHTSITQASIWIALADTGIALLSGMAIFPIVFANGLEPGQGPGLIFKTLPIAFGHMEAGTLVGTGFFVLLVFAAWTSAISLIEPPVAWLVENKGVSRIWAAIMCGLGAWTLGIGTILSFNKWSDVKWFDKTIFDLLDYLTANLMLPLGGLFIVLFSAWVMKREMCKDELAIKNIKMFELWYFLVRYVTPVCVVIVFLKAIDVI